MSTFQELYPFYTPWAIAFWQVLSYTPAQEESLRVRQQVCEARGVYVIGLVRDEASQTGDRVPSSLSISPPCGGEIDE